MKVNHCIFRKYLLQCATFCVFAVCCHYSASDAKCTACKFLRNASAGLLTAAGANRSRCSAPTLVRMVYTASAVRIWIRRCSTVPRLLSQGRSSFLCNSCGRAGRHAHFSTSVKGRFQSLQKIWIGTQNSAIQCHRAVCRRWRCRCGDFHHIGPFQDIALSKIVISDCLDSTVRTETNSVLPADRNGSDIVLVLNPALASVFVENNDVIKAELNL